MHHTNHSRKTKENEIVELCNEYILINKLRYILNNFFKILII